MEKANYYAIIPANVRYDKELRANEKLMYGEITALSNAKGVCWASNQYFASLYGVTPQAISKWISDLKRLGYISVEFVYKKGTKEIDKRFIKIVSTNNSNVSTNDLEGINKCLTPINQKVNDNNKKSNITSSNNKYEKYGEFKNVFLTDEEYRKIEKKGLTYLIEALSSYIASTGKKYKSHYATILNWSRRKPKKEVEAPSFDIEKYETYLSNRNLKYERKEE